MPAAPLPLDDDCLVALRGLAVLDTPPEAEFDALVQGAALACGVPISRLSWVDASWQWFKADHGLAGASETPRQQAFCAHATLQDGIFEVADATEDPRFADDPLVIGAFAIRCLDQSRSSAGSPGERRH